MGLTQKLGTIPLAIFTDASNNVGIGAAPSGTYKLEVTGTAKVSSTLLLGGALSGTSATFSGTLTTNGAIQQNSAQYLGSSAYFAANVTNGFRVLNAAESVALLSITNAGAATFASSISYSTYAKMSASGYIGVGNSLSGAFSAYDYVFLNDTNAAGGLFCLTRTGGGSMGGVYLYNGATSWAAYSDERLKNIKEEITGAVDILKQIRAVKYTWKSDTTETLNVGVIAQDIQKVLPEIIDVRNDEMNTLGVRHTELIPVLIAAIQELSAQNQDLKSRLDKAGL